MSQALDTYPRFGQEDFCFYSQPNRSLTDGERKWALLAIAATTLSIAAVFGWLGYWLILPFAGLEIGVLAWAFDAMGRRRGDYESVCIRGDEIVVERRQGESLERRTLNRQWVQLVLAGPKAGGKVRLALRSHGQETELGCFLTDEDRLELARRLQARIKAGR